MNSLIDHKSHDESLQSALEARLEASFEELREAAKNFSYASPEQARQGLEGLILAAENFIMARGARLANQTLYALECVECGRFLGYIINATTVSCPHCGACGEVSTYTESNMIQ